MNRKKRHISIVFMVLIFVASISLISCQKKAEPVDIETLKSRLVLEIEEDEKTGAKVSKGTFAVFEDRDAQEGRMIHLDVTVLHATGLEAKPDPLFFFAGGPGANVTDYAGRYARSWIREQRDIVLVSQRGTGKDNRLDCELAAQDENLQSYFDPLFKVDVFRSCLEELEEKFDLNMPADYQRHADRKADSHYLAKLHDIKRTQDGRLKDFGPDDIDAGNQHHHQQRCQPDPLKPTT